MKVSIGNCSASTVTWKFRLIPSRTSTFPTSIPTTGSTSRPRSPFSPDLPRTAGLSLQAITALESTHIEQVAARLNWPCVRVNLDSHISRVDLIGKDAIVIREGMQVTEFRDGILPWALQHNVAICFDEYDAGRPDVMFVIQRVLESSGA